MKKICEVCGQPWEYQYKVYYDENGIKTGCLHDGEFKASNPEFVPMSLKQDRRTYSKDILQPYRKDGSVNQDFVKAYGAQRHPEYNKEINKSINNHLKK